MDIGHILADMARNFAWFASVIFICSLAEYKWPAGPRPRLADRLQNMISFSVVLFLITVFHNLPWSLTSLLASHGMLGLLLGSWKPSGVLQSTLSALVFALVWDFFQYWQHRAMHANSVLWLAHAVHHEDERLNASSVLRVSYWSEMLGYFVAVIPTYVICGTSLLNYYSSAVLFATWGFFNHTNVRLNLGPLTTVVSGPHWHRIHHGKDAAYHDKNFAAFFPVWDIAFGTYRAPVPAEVVQTGLFDRPQNAFGIMQAVRDALGIGHLRARTRK